MGSIIKLIQCLGTMSAWISLASSLKILVANIKPLQRSFVSIQFLRILLRSLVATVTYLYKNLNNGLFIFS